MSHDIPFEDGVSGTIELTLTAQTPIFVRNGHTKDDAEAKNNNYKSFSKAPDNSYFIPATSIKGAVRNVLEIMSFGKMSNIANSRYTIRDLQLKKYINIFQNNEVRCGWMYIEKDKIKVDDMGVPGRISYREIDKIFLTDFEDEFKRDDVGRNESKKTPWYKYDKIKNKSLTYKFSIKKANADNPVDKRIFVYKDDTNGKEGTIVFTGQPGQRKDKKTGSDGKIIKKASGKLFDFVFFNERFDTYELDRYEKDGLFEDFRFVNNKSDIWKKWERKLNKGEKVPVFFVLNKDGSEILHFGLSYLYKLPYPKRLKEYLPADHRSNKLDLAECIFGTTSKQSLKGRIQFSHAFMTKGNPIEEREVYLGSPKPTYYPIYLKQQGENGYMTAKFKTMLDNDAQLKGFKRYPIHATVKDVKYSIPTGQEENANPFIAMDAGSTFTCKVRFHNLRKIELGALLKAIQFDNQGFHSIGYAKPYGYGKTKIIIESIVGTKESIPSLIEAFDNKISAEFPDYKRSQSIRELKLMSVEQKTTSPLEYMELKEFVDCKRQNFKKQISGEYLQPYSELVKLKKKKEAREILEGEAQITVLKGPTKQARLIDNDKFTGSISLEVPISNRDRLKRGDKIIVEYEIKSGKIQKLIFKSKA
ncbi:MAG TPA: TIGR03986 family CRISPR-associated RAMP protein [Paludibacter sp.]|nr:TIGR03986 family CRISPR-associated RAMP protein [Paludibacter sp.]